jgi:FkbM family methyltransferase
MNTPILILRRISIKVDGILSQFGLISNTERNKRLYIKKPISKSYPIDIEAKILWGISKDGDIFFDIGANKGLYSILIGSKVGKKNVFAFEPLPEYKNILTKSIGDNVYSIAMSDEKGTKSMKIPYVNGEKLDTRSTLEKGVTEENQTKNEVIDVYTDTIDNFVRKGNFETVDIIKVDVEGHEKKVIKGGLESIKKFDPIILVEIEQRHHEKNIKEIFNLIKSIGYSIYYYCPKRRDILSINNFNIKKDQRINDLRERNFRKYVNNFFLTKKSNERKFVRKVRTFLRKEKK